MFTYRRIGIAVAVAALSACATPTFAPYTYPSHGPNLGRAATNAEIAAWDISIPPSGAGLPRGGGTVKEGAILYATKCQACHGVHGAGKPVDALVGGIGTLASIDPIRTVGSYWPYATTLFDYVRRAMPANAPMSLSNDEVYAITAYILNANGIIPVDAEMNADTLPLVKMPNRDGFVDWSHK